MYRKISIYIEYFMMHSISLSFLSAHAWLVNTKFNIISTYKIFGKNKKKIIYIKYNCIACFISSDLFLARQLSDILCADESRLFGLGLRHGLASWSFVGVIFSSARSKWILLDECESGDWDEGLAIHFTGLFHFPFFPAASFQRPCLELASQIQCLSM